MTLMIVGKQSAAWAYGYEGDRKIRARSINSQEDESPLEHVSYDSRGRVDSGEPLIPNPIDYPAPWKLNSPARLDTTWGYGANENLYNKEIEKAVDLQWSDLDYPLDALTFKALVAQESAFNKDAVSRTKAVGLVQITAGTAEAYGVKVSPPPDERRDPKVCLPAGVRILADKLAVIKNPNPKLDYAAPVADYYARNGKPTSDQMTKLSLAGYNGGGSTVLRAMNYAIAGGLDPREWQNLTESSSSAKDTPLYKAVRDTFGDAGAMEKYREMAEYPERILAIQARGFHPLAGKKILVDPGHGGSDAGAIGPAGFKEANVNLAVGLKLRAKLQELGAEVRMTRDSDTNVAFPGAPQIEELKARVEIANSWPAEVFVSVHSNSSENASAHGTETYHSRNASATSKTFAKNVHEEMVAATGFRDRGVKEANFYVIKNTTMPGILVETGFISNAVEEVELNKEEVQDRMAQAIANGVSQTFLANSGLEVKEPVRAFDPPLEVLV